MSAGPCPGADRAKKGGIGEQEAPIAVGHRKPQRQRLYQRFHLGRGVAGRIVGHRGMRFHQQHQRGRVLRSDRPVFVEIVQRHVNQLKRLALAAGACEINPLAFVQTQEICKFTTGKRGRWIAGRPIDKGG